MYIDDIKIAPSAIFSREVQVLSIGNMLTYYCDQMPGPSITFRNNGAEALTSLTVGYQINNGQVTEKSWAGNMNPNATGTFSFGLLPTLPPGDYQLTVFTRNPNGGADQLPENDTMRTRFYVMGKAATPLEESFESTVFPPSQWVLEQNGNGYSWQRTTLAASAGNASAVMNNFQYQMAGRTDNLISPVITPDPAYDSLFLSFDYAYAPGLDYNNAGLPQDTLEVKITTDCGKTFITLFKKYGKDLVTVADPANKKDNAFVPSKGDWQSQRFYISPIAKATDFQIFFSSKGNHQNNLYLDNVQVYGIILPALLKEKGYLLYPSPFTNQFMVRNLEQPTDLKSIQIYNSTGQLVWQEQYNGTASKQIWINSNAWARGIYTVKMNFASKTIIDRVVKQ